LHFGGYASKGVGDHAVTFFETNTLTWLRTRFGVIFFSGPKAKRMPSCDLVQRVPIFRDLTQREFRQLERIFHRRTYAAGEMIVREGELGMGLYIIVSGQVEVCQQTKDRGTLIIASLGVGDFFGEQGLLDEAPRTASAQMVKPCIAIGLAFLGQICWIWWSAIPVWG
jgi:hypothetical protein